MIFNYSDGFYRIARVTGVAHNLLCLKFSDSKIPDIKVTSLNNNEPENITSDEVCKQIQNGIEFIRKTYSFDVFVSEIMFIPSDTYSSEVYSNLFIEVVRKVYPELTGASLIS